MNHLWNITAEDYINVVKICQELGMKPGESMEQVFLEYMEMKGQKPFASNEFTKDELLQQLAEKIIPYCQLKPIILANNRIKL